MRKLVVGLALAISFGAIANEEYWFTASVDVESASMKMFKTSLSLQMESIETKQIWRELSEDTENLEDVRSRINAHYRSFLASRGQYQHLHKDRMVLITHQNSDLEEKTRRFIEQNFSINSEDIVILASELFKVRERETLDIPSQILFSTGGEIGLPDLQAKDFHLMGGFVQLCLRRSILDILKLTRGDISLTVYTNLTYASFGHLKDWHVKDGLINKIWRRLKKLDGLDTQIEEISSKTTFVFKNKKRTVRLHFQD